MITKFLKVAVILSLFITAAAVSAYLALTLIVKSEATVIVPALKEKEVVQALRMLSALGLNTRVKASEYSASIPVNYVIDQDPAPGSEIKKGRNVKLVISRGRQSVSVPDLTGISIHQALMVLEEHGLCRGIRSRSSSPTLAQEVVMAQTPLPGMTINRKNCVDLLVSTGRYRSAFAMPDLADLPIEEAILKIEAEQLQLGDITESKIRSAALNTVADQTPPAGHRVTEGQAVHLGVYRSPSAHRQATAAGRRQPWFFGYQAGNGFLNRHIKVRVSSKTVSYDLYDGFVPPAGKLSFLIPRFENVAIMLYEDEELIKTIFPGSLVTWSESVSFGLPGH